jgi:ubiquilin
MSAAFQGSGGLGNPFAAGSGGFPAPGTPGGNPASPTTTENPISPFNMFAPTAARTNPGAGAFNMDPTAMQQLLGMMGGMDGMSGLAGVAQAQPPVPTDTRSPEERFQVQLQVRFLPHFVSQSRFVYVVCHLFLGVTYPLHPSILL